MAEFFEPSVLGGPEGSPITPMSPIERPGYEVVLSSVGRTLGGVSQGLADLTKLRAEQAKEAEIARIKAEGDRTVAEFTNKQLAISQALETGQIKSSAEARTRMRQNLTRYIADNPSLATDLGNAHKLFTKQSGLGDSVYEGTEEEQMWNKVEQDAVSAGWVMPGQSEQERQQAALSYAQFKKAQDMMAFEQKQYALATAKVGLTNANLETQNKMASLREKQLKQAATVSVGQMANTYSTHVNNKLTAILRDKEAGKIDTQAATIQMDQVLFEVDNLIRQQGGQAGADYINSMTAPMRLQVDNYKKYLSGELNKVALDNANATAIGIQQSLYLKDPKNAQLVAASKFFPNSSFVQGQQVTDSMMRFFEVNNVPETKPADILPDYEQGKTDVGGYFDVLKETAGKLNQGTAIDPEATVKDFNVNLDNIMKGIEVYGPQSRPQDFNQFLNFMASPDIGKYISANGGLPSPASANKAKQVLMETYNMQVEPLLQEEYLKAQTGGKLVLETAGRTQRPVIEGKQAANVLIQPVFTGSGITFQSTEVRPSTYTIQKVKELNKNVAPIVNKLVQANAHMDGHQDYKRVYEEQFSKLFEVGNENSEQGNNQAE